MAKNSAQKLEWILLIHQLPPKPTNLRVRVWRKLQKLGAVAIKNSVYVLPANEKTHEDFQWLKQEIESAGGDATVFQAASVEGATDDEIVAAFRKARDEEFAAVTAELDGLTGAIRGQTRGKHLSAGRLAAHETEIDNLDLANYQGRRWMTRRNLHIDRLASAWLTRQFIDKRPRFYFVAEGETLEGAIAFDMFGAEFTHRGEDCTFETILKRFGLNGKRNRSNLRLQTLAKSLAKNSDFNYLP